MYTGDTLVSEFKCGFDAIYRSLQSSNERVTLWVWFFCCLFVERGERAGVRR